MNPILVDRFGRRHNYLRISITDRCNLRCLYCMPPEGVNWKEHDEILRYEEIIRIARIFVDLGIDKIRLTGGEPTVRKGIDDLIEELSGLKGLNSLAMTTNGIVLKDKAAIFRAKGLDRLNISLDTLRRERFAKITRRDNFEDVLAGIEASIEAGFSPVKLNMVVMAGVNSDEILDFVEFAKSRPVNVRFIEFMPFKNNGWQDAGFFPYADMKALIQERYSLIPIRVNASDVAKDFAIEGFTGTVSFITSMSHSFCGTCNRIRLTADGSIKTCLFYSAEMNVRQLLRDGASDETLKNKILEALLFKPEGHPDMYELPGIENRSMIQIGG